MRLREKDASYKYREDGFGKHRNDIRGYIMSKHYAMMLSTTDDLFQEEIWVSLSEYVEKFDDKMYFFCGKPINSTLNDECYSNVIFNLMKQLPMDGLISLTGSLSHYIGLKKYNEYIKQFDNMHKISISVPLEGCTNVLLDGYGSSYTLCEHLIDHGYTTFGVIKGPDQTTESLSRYRGTMVALMTRGIKLTHSVVGDFSKDSGYHGATVLLDKGVDVIISANDQMALGAYQAIAERGLRIPNDIAVVGFDDIEQAKLQEVPLTTVKQPFSEMVRSAYDLLRFNRRSDIHHLGEIKIRESCGCNKQVLDAITEMDMKRFYMNKYQESIYEYNQTLTLHDKFDRVDTMEKLNDAITNYLDEVKGRELHLCLFEEKAIVIESPETFEYPTWMNYQYGYLNGSVKKFGRYKTSTGLPLEALKISTSKALLIYPVNQYNLSYGYIVTDANTAKSKTFTSLRREIVNALNRIDMFEQIHRYSKQMKRLASMDAMTGLLNRRGFFSFVEVDYYEKLKHLKNPGIIFCDINGLKKVNDNYGHATGDQLIISASDILKKVFASNTIARLGGDEFIIYLDDCNDQMLNDIIGNLENEISIYNECNCNSFTLSLEAGMAKIIGTQHVSLDELISQADHMLYVKKGRHHF